MIERTMDYRIVKRLTNWNLIISSKCFYLLEKVKSEVRGVWALQEYKDGLMIHAGMGPKCRGKDAILSSKFAFDWIFRNTKFRKIYANIPVENKPACRVASTSGMRLISSDSKSRCFKLSKRW